MKKFQVPDTSLIASDREGAICMNCRYFDFSGDSYEHQFPDDIGCEGDSCESYGQCVRFPPVYVGMPAGEHEMNRPYQWRQPDVDPISYCGEFSQRQRDV